jgi:hypothetical protein
MKKSPFYRHFYIGAGEFNTSTVLYRIIQNKRIVPKSPKGRNTQPPETGKEKFP